MSKFQFLYITFSSLIYSAIFSQNISNKFIFPLERNPVVTGNYGELRPNHFHAGLDFSTDPKINLPIKSISDGYVSRIKISSGGYGRVLYITHANGYVSVYAHQKKYASKIDVYVKKKQIEQQKNEIELILNPNEIVVKQGEVIGYTGNSGSSTGPHLHFEIREEKSEIPLNPLLFYTISDNIKPVLTHLALYNSLDSNNIKQTKTIQLNNKQKGGNSELNKLIFVDNNFAIGYSGYDMADASTNKNNIYEAKVLLDGKLIYNHQLNNISFDDARYVNYFSEKENGIKIQKCFAPNCQNIGLYKTLANKGIITLSDTLIHNLKLEVFDEKGNKNEQTFKVKSKNNSNNKDSKIKVNAFCNKDFNLKQNNIDIFIKAGSMVENCDIKIQSLNNSDYFSVISTSDFLMHPMVVSFNPIKINKSYADKIVMMCNQNSIGGKFENNKLVAESKSFGIFSYKYDTIPPTITLIKNKKQLNFKNKISFKINDNLSRIKDYNLFINDKWCITEYDAKTSTITCFFDEQTPKGNVHLKLIVTDKVENKSTFESQELFE